MIKAFRFTQTSGRNQAACSVPRARVAGQTAPQLPALHRESGEVMLRDNQEPIVILALAGIFQLAFVIEGSPLLGPMI
jgi:hypothetical protein